MAFKNKKHSKVGDTAMRAFHFRIETSPEEFKKLHSTLDLGFELRNLQVAALEESRAQAKLDKAKGLEPHYLSAFDLKKAVASDKLDAKFKDLHSQVRQAISLQISEGQKRWFEALKSGRSNVRPPRRMMRKHFRSITYPQYGTAAHIKNGKLHLSKLGEFRIIGWRKMRGAKKSVTIKFKDGHFWAIVMCAVQQADVCRPYSDLKDSLPDAGMDPGLAAAMTDSYGNSYETPKPLKAAQKKLRHIQKDVSRKFEVRKAIHLKDLAKVRQATGSMAPVAEGLVDSLRQIPYSNRLKANIVKLAKAHTKVANARKDVAAKVARKVEKKFARVAMEDHGLQFMTKNRKLAKTAADVAIGAQKFAIQSAMGKGRYFLAPNRRPEGGNSQTCLCGESVPKALNDRWHTCPSCGLSASRDQVSAIIVQHTAFGSVPTISKESTPGLGVLERAVKALETRRGESKGKGGESRVAERPAKVALEPSTKRPARRIDSARKTTGGAQAPSVEVKTIGHASVASSWSIETKVRVLRERSTTSRNGISGLNQKHPPSGG